MNTYLRILTYARKDLWIVPIYILVIILHTFFRVVNFTALIPVLQLLFDNNSEIPKVAELPAFQLSDKYLIDGFYYYFGRIIEMEGKLQALYFICGILLVTVLLSNLFQYFSALLQAKVRINAITELRGAVYKKLTSLSLGYFTTARKGDLISRINTDALQVEVAIVNSMKVLFKEPFLIAGFFVAMFRISSEMTLYTLLLIPISAGIISVIARRLKRRAIKTQKSLGRISSIVEESISGMKIIKSFTARDYMLGKFSDELSRYARHNFRMVARNNLSGPVSEFLGVAFLSLILIIGGQAVLNDTSTLGAAQFIVFLVIFSQVLSPAKSVSSAFSNIQRGLAAGERLFELMDQESATKAHTGTYIPVGFEKKIRFNKVSFSYEEAEVLREIDFQVAKGEVVALVGPSGAGKSTLADLVSRFYEPRSGSITIDDVDIKEWKVEELRKMVGVVSQDSILFHDTVFNNIAFGIPDASHEQVETAAKIANAHDFIVEMEDGYHSYVGDAGSKLSGGQKQRISIARAVLKNPPILILDEATSALDTESEKLVQDAITRLMKNRTTLVIAHRLSTIQHADKILFMSQGKIMETGSHEDLLEKGGEYKRLIEMQSIEK